MTDKSKKSKVEEPEVDKADDKECFVIMPISDQHGYEDGHFQLVYEDIISPAVEAAGLKPYRGDDTKNSNLIQLDILKRIIHTPMAVCDISSKNPNVFYELGMRQAFDMPTVLIKDESTDTPFDISGLRYVEYRKGMRHRDVTEAIKELTEMVRDTFEKREDKSEVHSLIRLMDLVSPAKIMQSDMSEEARHGVRQELLIENVLDELRSIQSKQDHVLYRLDKVEGSENGVTKLSYTDGTVASDSARLLYKMNEKSGPAAIFNLTGK